MTSREYIEKQIDTMVSLFSKIKVRYEFDALSSCHIIEISPLSFYKTEFKVNEFEFQVISEFLANFSEEGICFISEGDLIEIENPLIEKAGSLYGTNLESSVSTTRLPTIVPYAVYSSKDKSSSNLMNVIFLDYKGGSSSNKLPNANNDVDFIDKVYEALAA